MSKENLPNENLTVDDVTCLKRSKPTQILKETKAGLFSSRQGQYKRSPTVWKGSPNVFGSAGSKKGKTKTANALILLA
jgi:hypothetical protein